MKKQTKMKKQTLLFLLTMLLALTGCDKECSTLECEQEPLVFKLTDAEGNNLMDNGTLTLSKVSLQPANAYFFPPQLTAVRYGNETWVEAATLGNTEAFELTAEGYEPQPLKLTFNVNRGECCTSVTISEVVYKGTPVTKAAFGRTFILP